MLQRSLTTLFVFLVPAHRCMIFRCSKQVPKNVLLLLLCLLHLFLLLVSTPSHTKIYIVLRQLLKQAEYISGNMSDTLVFRYTVVEGDNTDAFDILDTRTTKRQQFSTALTRPPAAEVRK